MLVFHCKSCDYTEDADPSAWCVYRNEVHHTSKERTVILQVRPCVPRTPSSALFDRDAQRCHSIDLTQGQATFRCYNVRCRP